MWHTAGVSMSLVSIITCTGFRPEALALCQKFIERQTYKGPIQWIVVKDDNSGFKQSTTSKHITIDEFAAPKLWVEGYNTHRSNMEFAMTKVAGEYLFIMEDDDYYKPEYIETMLAMLKHVEFVGIIKAKYYHVQMPGWKILGNDKMASLSQTALSKWGYPYLNKAINSGDLYFDRHLWHHSILANRPHMFLGNSTLSIGMKGLPGREGITSSHRDLKDYMIDPPITKLRDWMGEDCYLYRDFSKRINQAIIRDEEQKAKHKPNAAVVGRNLARGMFGNKVNQILDSKSPAVRGKMNQGLDEIIANLALIQRPTPVVNKDVAKLK
jgi:glycosyltransferase involved in cell wall biosynthesis